MKLFIKHLWRDLLKFPTQTLLVLMTLILSTAVAVSAIGSFYMIGEHITRNAVPNSVLGDITVEPTGDKTRIIFERDTRAALGDKGRILGEFSLSAFMKTENGEDDTLVSLSAVDLLSADSFFEFEYSAVGDLTTRNVDRTAIISATAAKRLSLELGDSFTISMLGRSRSYTVGAIAKDAGLLLSSDMLVSIEGVKNILAEELPAVSAMGEELLPYTRLIVKLDGSLEMSEAAAMIEEGTKSCRVSTTANEAHASLLAATEIGGITILAATVIILCAALTLSSLMLLHEKRRREYALFALAGADRSKINMLKFAESGIYALVGAVFGILLAVPMLATIGSFFAWRTEPLRLTAREAVFGVIFAPTLIALCTALAIKKSNSSAIEAIAEDKKQRADKGKRSRFAISGIILLVLCVICLAICAALPTSHKYVPALAALPMLLAAVYILMPTLQAKLGAFVADRLMSSKKCRGGGVLCFRNFENVYPLRQITRLCALLVAVLMAIFVARAAIANMSYTLENVISTELAAVGVDERAYSKISKLDFVSSVAKVGFAPATDQKSGYSLNVISMSGDTDNCIMKELMPKKLPEKGAVAISDTVASLCGFKLGDTMTLDMKGTIYSLTVEEICKNGINSVIVNASTIDVDNFVYAIKLEEGTDVKSAKRALTEKLEIYGATVTDPDVLFGTSPKTTSGFVALATAAAVISAFTVLVGFADTLIRHYKEREREREILRIVGMTRARFVRSSLAEITLSFGFALAIAIPLGIATVGIVNIVAGSFGFSLLGLL